MNYGHGTLDNLLRRRRHVGLAVIALLVLLAALGWTLRTTEAEALKVPAVATAPDGIAPLPAQAPTRAGTFAQDSYADVVARVAPDVVTVRSERRARAVSMPFDEDSILGQLMPNHPRVQPREQGALGSGVIVRPDGYVLTNHHVVEGAEQVKVDLTDGRTFDARVVGSDQPSDLAVLKVNATNLPTVALASSDRVRVGDVVLAIGNPLGVGQTVTMGIISAKGRATGLTDGSFEDFLQTDAPINQGNSGGALVTAHGELIGINSQILSPSGGNIGIGFAIPASMASGVMDQLIKDGQVRRGMLGVHVQGVTSDIAASLGLKEPRGALVSGVDADSPAGHAGLRRGDVVTMFDGQAITDSNSLRNQVARTLPGTKVTLGVVRDGRNEAVTATLGELPAPRVLRTAAGGERRGSADSGRFGMSVAPLTPDIASELRLKESAGVVVEDVAPMSPAANAGIRSGDVIKEVNRKPVRSVADLQEGLRTVADRPALVLVSRNGAEIFVALAAPTSPDHGE
jgi:serine protease Do